MGGRIEGMVIQSCVRRRFERDEPDAAAGEGARCSGGRRTGCAEKHEHKTQFYSCLRPIPSNSVLPPQRRDGNIPPALLRMAQPPIDLDRPRNVVFPLPPPARFSPPLRPPATPCLHPETESPSPSQRHYSRRGIRRESSPTGSEGSRRRRFARGKGGEECFQLEFIVTVREETKRAAVGLWDENVGRNYDPLFCVLSRLARHRYHVGTGSAEYYAGGVPLPP